jgi:hypothetical protein
MEARMMRRFGSLVLLLFVVLSGPPTLDAFDSVPVTRNAQPLSILRITPDGVDVRPGRQIVFQFNRPVVPVGRMDRDASEIPITITPPLNCQWRWLNTSALACQLGEKAAMRPANRYAIVVHPGITAEDGTTLSSPVHHTFITERPKVRHAWFKTWKAPGMPHVRMIFNQPVSRQSVERHVFMVVPDDGSQLIWLHVEPDPDDRHKPLVLAAPGEKVSVISGPSDPAAAQKDTTAEGQGAEARRVWVVSPGRELPLDTAVQLRVEPGLVSFLGPEPGVEDRIVLAFRTFPEFTFTGIECTDNAGQPVTIPPGTNLAHQPRCNPLRGVALGFTAPVIREAVKDHVTVTPDLAGGREDYDPWASRRGYSRLDSPHRQGQTYSVWLPEVLKAFQVYQIKSDPENFRDEFGRVLTLPIDMQFATDHRPPDFTLTHPKAVLEKAVDTEMPLVVTNLDSVTVTYDRLTTEGKRSGQIQRLALSKAEDIAFSVPLQIRRLLAGQSGVVAGTIDSVPGVDKSPLDRWFFAQVTPFHVHAKVGHYNTLVWLMDLATGEPVSDATVKIYRAPYAVLPDRPPILSEAVTDQTGIAMLAGTHQLDPELRSTHAYDPKAPRLFVRVQKANDMALVPLDYHFRVDTYRVSRYSVYPRMRSRYGHIHTWGTTAQGVYKAGDTIQYKLYVRDQDNETLIPAPKEGYTLKVVDPMDKTVHEVKDLVLSEFGAHDGEFRVPSNGAVGWYRFQLTSTFSDWTWEPMRVLVSDFTPAPFRVTIDLKGQRFQPGNAVEVMTQASLHAGGPYVDAQARVTATLESRTFRSQDPAARGFWFDVFVPDRPTRETVHQAESTVDNQGHLISRFTLPDSHILYGTLTVESAVRDDRGKYVTSLARADYAGRDRYVGLRRTAWVLHEDEPARIDVLVVNEQGKPMAGTPITVTVQRKETKAARVKGAGNAYLTHYTHQWVEVSRCDLVSATGPIGYEFTPQDPGSYRAIATIKDTRDRTHSSHLDQWVIGKGRVLWEESPDNSLEIIPEKESYRVGERARFLVKNPFPAARAWITIERYGVLKSWVETFDTSTPIIEFEVAEDYLPGYFLSVVVMSPRVEKPPVDHQVDLGKPAFRMGYVAVPVIDPYKEMTVQVLPERDTYKPRDQVKVHLHAKPRKGSNQEPVELAVAVLDESVLDLLVQGRDTFDPYTGFYTIDGLDLENYSLLLRLVGRQKFETKGATAGGGGGLDIGLRSVFRFVSFWNPSLITDAKGRASIEFEAPDNLTGWRVLAMAVTPTDRMGLGDNRFNVNRPTEIRPVMPNQVAEGDSFQAGFSIMNRTPQRRELTVLVTAQGVIETDPAEKTLGTVTQTLVADPYKRTTVWLPVKTTGEGEVRFTARAGDDIDQDGMIHTLAVRKRYSLERAATYGTIACDILRESILFPEPIRTDVGRVSVVVSPSIIGNLEGAFEYLRDYPYICWEQILTRGVMASHYQNLKGYMSDEFQWDGSENLPQETLEKSTVYQAPNGGMTYYVPQDPYVSPYLSAYTALAFNWLRKRGHEIPSAVQDKLHAYLLRLLRRDVVPDFYSRGMVSTVRAVALAALAEHGQVGISDLERHRSHVPEMSLFGKAHFLGAAVRVSGTEAMQRDVANLILAHANQSGGKFVFSETIDNSYSRILASPLRANGAILSALIAFAETPQGSQIVGDIPFKLLRTITQTRKNHGHWDNTQENLFCMNALIDYSRVYEKEKPDMELQAFLDTDFMGKTHFKDLRDEPVEFKRPLRADDPGRKSTLTLQRQGDGRVYYGARLFFAPEGLKAGAINAGIEIHREYSVERDGKWILLQSPMQLKRGELVRVDLYVSLPTARNFVVVDDPVPGGLEPVSRDLATASQVDAEKAVFHHAGGSWWFRTRDWSSYGLSRWSFYHQELRHEAARFYSEYLSAGNYHLSYTAQAIAPGEFIVLPVHAEEMYDPDIHGKGVSATLNVSRE